MLRYKKNSQQIVENTTNNFSPTAAPQKNVERDIPDYDLGGIDDRDEYHAYDEFQTEERDQSPQLAIVTHLKSHWPKYFALLMPLSYAGYKMTSVTPGFTGFLVQLPLLLLGTLMLYFSACRVKSDAEDQKRKAALLQANPLFMLIGAMAGFGFFLLAKGVSVIDIFAPGWQNQLVSGASMTGQEPLLMSAAQYTGGGAAAVYFTLVIMEKFRNRY